MITPPLKKAPYEFHSLDELRLLIGRRGQFFGEDKSGPASNYNPSYPSDQTLYQYLKLKGHNGLDIPCNDSEPILAAHDGIVIETSNDEKAGLGVVLWDDKQLIKTIYWHLKSFTAQVGDRFKQGDILRLADNTGLSSGTHLHFGLKKTNNEGTTLGWDNGYFGAVDPWNYIRWFNSMTEEQVIKQYILARRIRPTAEELSHWVGRTLDEFQDTMLKDDGKLLEDYK